MLHSPIMTQLPQRKRVMATTARISSLVALLLISLVAPSIAQGTTPMPSQTTRVTTGPTTDQPTSSMQTPVSGTTPPPPPSTIAARDSVPPALIIGPAVGGGVVLLVLVLCICVCICCVCKRRTRNKHKVFVPSVSEKLPSEVGSPVYRTLTPPEIHSDLDKKEEFQMQVNVAHSADVTVELDDHTIKPSQLFVKKSASSSNINIHETTFNGDIRRTATNPMATAHSISNTEQPPELKGYVQMSSAGSVHPSKSLGDVASAGEEEQDTGIYVEPDRTGAALLIQAESFRDPPPSTSPPVLHPKTPSMTADMALGKSPSPVVHKPTLSLMAEQLGRLESEEYVTTDVFRIDRQTQEEIDSYYNKDTIESIRQGRGLTDVTDPSDAIYTSVDTPSSSTPAHQSNLTASADDHLENRAEFLRGKAAPRTSPAHVEGDGKENGEETEEEGYYNVKHHTGSDDEDAYDYYNSVQGLSGGSNQPLIDPEDNQYVYIEKSAVPQPAPPAAAATATHGTGKPLVAAKPRHLSEPNTNQPRKYINLGPNQRQVLQGKAQGPAGESTDKKSRGDSPHAPVSNGLANGGSGVSDSEDQPLYENLREEEAAEEDEGGREIYENIMK